MFGGSGLGLKSLEDRMAGSIRVIPGLIVLQPDEEH